MDSHRLPERCHVFKAKLGPMRLNFNPVVTIVSGIIIWGFVIWCVLNPDAADKNMTDTKSWITVTFTWLYIGTVNVLLVFLIYLYFSKYSSLKLGAPDDKPEFSDAAYFTMLFAAGIGIGLFYFSVSEPIAHYQPNKENDNKSFGNRYWGRYSDNQRAQDAINVTLFHWGIHGWVVYSLLGLIMAFVSYRKGLPMTIRSCFYPILGERVFGLVGDVIDIFSVVCTMFGVCTSLGFGVISLNSGFHRLNSSISLSITNQMWIIWGVTAVATASVVSGLKMGIRRLSELCFIIGMFLMMFILFRGNTWYILNLYVQSIGYYLQNLVQLGFHTDAFEQVGNAPDGKQAPEWINDWTIFYWGWWVAFGPFVGMFIAKISRGRTIRNFLNATLTAPVLYIFLWFCIFGGASLKMERDAIIAGANCSNPVYSYTDENNVVVKLYKLSCRPSFERYFDLYEQYGEDMAYFLHVISIIGMMLYFVTSSDSGSLVIDCLSANGSPEPPVVQRVFWALTEGACATALVKVGGEAALKALRAVSIAAGLPYTILLLFLCVALMRVVKEEAGDIDPNAGKFSSSAFDIIDNPSLHGFQRLFVALVAPWWPAGRAAAKNANKSPWGYMIVLALLFYSWVFLEILQVVDVSLAYVGWVVLCGFFAYVTIGVRLAIREKHGIAGNILEDILIVVIFYPLAIDQMDKEMLIRERQRKDEPATSCCLQNKNSADTATTIM